MLSTHSFPARDISLSSFVEGRELLPAGNSRVKEKKIKKEKNNKIRKGTLTNICPKFILKGEGKREKTLRSKPVRGKINLIVIVYSLHIF